MDLYPLFTQGPGDHRFPHTYHYRRNSELQLPIRTWLANEWQTTLFAPTSLYRLVIDELGQLKLSPGRLNDRRSNDLTENDLLEEDASIFQYKVEIGGPGSGSSYRRWLREQRRNTMVFNFLTRQLGLENAYLALPPLVHAAFSTTVPLETFGELVALTMRADSDLPSQRGIDNYAIYLRNALSSFNLGYRVPNPDLPSSDDPVSLIGGPEVFQLLGSSSRHPLWPLANKLWSKREERQQLSEYMLHPYRAINRRAGTVSKMLRAYWPPLSVYRLLVPDMSVNDAVWQVAPSYVGKPVPSMPIPGFTYDQYLPELVGRRYLAFSLVTDMYDDGPHNCYHTECPYFSTNLCRRWLHPPREYLECDFPKMMEIATYHHLDSQVGVLRPRNYERRTCNV